MIHITVGEFVQEHIPNIIRYCESNKNELDKLQDMSYSKDTFGVDTSFITLSAKAKKGHWKTLWKIGNDEYQFCKLLGISEKIGDKITSELHGDLFLKYLKEKYILLLGYATEEIVFTPYSVSIQKDEPIMNRSKQITKNIILYGPPGVGKTHNYQNIISMIEDEQDEKYIFDTITDNKETTLDSDTFQIIKNEGRVKFITFHQSYSYEDFIEGFRPQKDGGIVLEDGIFKDISNQASDDMEQNFYLIIDEINRGNISKIFGELITIIEEDKRDIYEIDLQYSKTPFKVPSNLYIIVTMNSSDKSIATIDIALRRRFTFLEMKPNLDLVDDDEAKELMEKVNLYIKDKIGEDYMLGHSYFMKIKNDDDLEFIKQYKIKPLLKEYFYSEDKSIDDIMKEVEDYIIKA